MMKFFVTVVISGLLAWFIAGALHTRNSTPEVAILSGAPTTVVETSTAPTVAEIKAMAPEKRLHAITKFHQLSSVREIMEALGQLDELSQRESMLASQVLFMRWAELAPEQAMRYVLQKQDGDSSVMFDEFKIILTVLRTKDPAHPLDLLMKCDPDYFNTGWTYGLDFDVLKDAIIRNPKSSLASTLAGQMFDSLLPTDPTTGAVVATVADLESAADVIAKTPKEIQSLLYPSLASAWAKLDMGAALEWARGLPPAFQETSVSSILYSKLKTVKDQSAVESVLSQTNDPETLKELLISLTGSNPVLALNWFTAHAAEPFAQSQRRLQQETLKKVAATNPEVAVSWLQANPDISETLQERTLATVAATISPNDPELAASLAGGLSEASQKWLYKKIAIDLTRKDLDGGLALALKGGDAETTLVEIIKNWKTTSEYQSQGLQPMIDKLSVVAPDKLGVVIDPSFFSSVPAYQDFLRQLTPEQRDGALRSGARALMHFDLTAAADYFAAQAPGPGRETAMADAAFTLSKTNPTAGTTWLANLPEDNAKALAIRNFASGYFKSDAAAATAWMEGLPASQADTARRTYVEILNNNGQSAAAWEQALKLSAADAREGALAQVLSAWPDRAAAQAAFSASKLDAKTKQALSQKISAP